MTRFTPDPKRWTCSPSLLSLLFISLLVCRTQPLDFAGYQNITLTSIPQSVYTITSRLSVLSCRASGYSSSSGTTEPLDVVFFRNESPMTNKYHMPSRHFYTTDNGLTATGLLIDPTRLEDNDVKFKCKVFINGHIVNVSSPQVTIIVADGRPPAVPLQLSSKTIQSATLQWDAPLLPSDGPLLHYTGYLYPEEDEINISSDSLSFTFTNLLPDTLYSVRVVAVNAYGKGNESALVSFRTQQSLQAPSPPSLSFTAGEDSLELTWEMPVISNYNNTYPISYYTVEYRPTSSPSSPFTRFNTSDNATLSVTISGLSVGVLYSFKVTPFNYGSGSPNSVEGTFRITQPSVSTTHQSSTQHILASTTETTPTPTTSSLASTSFTSMTTPTSSVTQSTPTSSLESMTIHSSEKSSQATPIDTPTSSSSIVSSSESTTSSEATPTATTPTSTYTFSFTNSVTSASSPNPSSSVAATEPQTGGTSSRAIVFASAVIASIILIAILVIAVILIGFCFYTNRRKHGDVNLATVSATWPGERRPSSMKRSGSKDSSIKGSSLSGSISHSLSSDQDLPSFQMNGHSHTSSSNAPSDSPFSHKTDPDLGSIEELPYEEEIAENPVCTEV